MKKRVYFSICILGCLLLTACGSSVGTNTEAYFTYTKAVLDTLFSGSGKKNSIQSAEVEKLDVPGNFVIDENGNYSFEGVEGAAYYLIYFCEPDAVDDGDSYLYTSAPIEQNESGSYTGCCADEFRYGYGEYLAKVYAFPDITDSEHTLSQAAVQKFVSRGEQSAPEIYYYWDTFTNTMNIQVANRENYFYEAYPDRIEVTFTNLQDSSDVVEVTIDGVSEENYSAQEEGLSRGASYYMTAEAISTNEYVLNPTSDISVICDELTLGETHLFTDGYFYSDNFPNDIYRFAVIGESLALNEEGDAGHAIGEFGTTIFKTTPVDSVNEAEYSFSVELYPDFHVDAPGLIITMGEIEASINLFSDGTFKMEQTGSGPINAASIEGTWIDNEDGTATLNYDHASIEIK